MKSIQRIALLLGAACALEAGVVQYTYDDAGRLVSADYGNGKTISYTYDAAGNLTSRTVTTPATSSAPSKAPAANAANAGNPKTALKRNRKAAPHNP